MGGTHWGAGRTRGSADSGAWTMRALAAAALSAAAVVALGIAGSDAQLTVMSDGGPAAGSDGPAAAGNPTPPAGALPSGSVLQPGPPGAFDGLLTDALLNDAKALVPFNRPIVRTIPKGGRPQLKVATVELKRPPKGFLMAPLAVLKPSSPFGFRVSPLTGSGGDFHLGQDYAAACGTRVYAADSGVVRAAGWHPWGGGNRVEVDHGNGLITTYNHLEAIAVNTGDAVDAGQVIARVGTTGWSTGCHLHFETILHGRHTSPLNWTLISLRQLDGLGDAAMVNYVTGPASADDGPLRWAIPEGPDRRHAVLFGNNGLVTPPPTSAAAPTSTQAPAPVPTETATPAPVPTETPTPAAVPTETEPPAPPETPTPAPAPSETAPAPVPTETLAPTETPTSAPAPAGTTAPAAPPSTTASTEPPRAQPATAPPTLTDPQRRNRSGPVLLPLGNESPVQPTSGGPHRDSTPLHSLYPQ